MILMAGFESFRSGSVLRYIIIFMFFKIIFLSGCGWGECYLYAQLPSKGTITGEQFIALEIKGNSLSLGCSTRYPLHRENRENGKNKF